MSYSICGDLAILKTLGDMGDFNSATVFQMKFFSPIGKKPALVLSFMVIMCAH